MGMPTGAETTAMTWGRNCNEANRMPEKAGRGEGMDGEKSLRDGGRWEGGMKRRKEC